MSNLHLCKLTNDEFIALRSLHRETWYEDGTFYWKHNTRWYICSPDGWLYRDTPDGGRCYQPDIQDRAQAALLRLGRLGLASKQKLLCCPGEACHSNDRIVWKLTVDGAALLAQANRVVVPKKPRVSRRRRTRSWLSRILGKLSPRLSNAFDRAAGRRKFIRRKARPQVAG